MSAVPFDLERIGRGLPFAASVPDLETALRERIAVVQAPPGTGKTTLVPPVIANVLTRATAASQPHGRVIVVQPRRVAARAAARRLVALTGTQPGEVVGWSVRGESTTKPGTRIEFVTPGIMLRRLLRDPDLPGTAAVALDEVHERGVESDLLVGMLAQLRELREDLTVVAMSATVDAARFAQLLGTDNPAPIVDCPSALYPLTIDWAPGPQRLDDRGVTPAFLSHVAWTAAAAHAEALKTHAGTDALVFVPGAREVSRVAGELRRLTDAEILELHGQLSPGEQDRAVAGRAPGDPPRIVVTTSLAESSLTVNGVRLVIDSGLARQPRRDAGRAMSGLVTVSASKASADQRAGRAARQGPGAVVRCYDDATWGAMPAHTVPDVRTADLTVACLALAVWGAPGGEGLSLPDPLPARARADADAHLLRLGAIDAAGRATDLGRVLADMPVEPRWGRALLDGAALVGRRAAAEVVAAIADGARIPAADIPAFVRRLRSGGGAESARWKREVSRLERICGQHDAAAEPGVGRISAAHAPLAGTDSHGAVPRDAREGAVVGLGKPEWVAKRVDETGEQWLLATGTRAGLEPGSPLRQYEWLAVAELSRAAGRVAAGTGAAIRAAAPLDEPTALLIAGSSVSEQTRGEFVNGKVRARRVRTVGAIELSSTPVSADPQSALPAVRSALHRQGLQLLPWDDAARSLRARLALLHRHLGDSWPAVDDAALLDRLDDWLSVELHAIARGASLRSIELADALRRLLPWPEAGRLEELVPQRLAVPSGNTARIDYPQVYSLDEPEQPPAVAVKLQECFGWADTPRLVEGRVPVQFHLLSPARRPLAITDDLQSFWSGPYQQVRSEMRGRYPKHPWPKDPWNAVATARTKKRSGR